jgi:adenine phosphoribosyltransferase
MTNMEEDFERTIKRLVRPVRGFPNPEFVFGDITPLLADAKAFGAVIGTLAERYKDAGLTAIAAPEARGFFFGPPLARELGLPFIPIRKSGQLPGPAHTSESTQMDYGSRVLQVHDVSVLSFCPGTVVIVDDILATGGSALACVQVLKELGFQVTELAVVYDYSDGDSVLHGKSALEAAGIAVHKLATFCKDGDMRWWLERGMEDEVVTSPYIGKISKEH